jgi:hypothetical protein
MFTRIFAMNDEAPRSREVARVLAALCGFALIGCAADERDDAGLTGAGIGEDGGGPSTQTTGDPPTETSGGSPGDDGAGTPKLDVAPSDTAGNPGDQGVGCEKIDFLFVIDNSGSMQDEQQNLKNSFPGFIGAIRDTLDAQDYHIMAVSTDNGQNTGLMSSCTNGVCTCTPAPVCCENACNSGSGTCNGFPCDDLPIGGCDLQYGTGKTYDENGTDCQLAEDRRYMLDGQPDLEGAFTCVASVGTYGAGNEKPMLALTEAVGKPHNEAMGCNAGFLRDDAILVVTFITDEEDDNAGDDGSPGGPEQWAADLIAAKQGNGGAVVPLGLFGDSDVPGGQCVPGADPGGGGDGAEPAPRLRAFVEQFENGVVGSVCAPDYAPFFLEAVAVIDVACDTFVPEG